MARGTAQSFVKSARNLMVTSAAIILVACGGGGGGGVSSTPSAPLTPTPTPTPTPTAFSISAPTRATKGAADPVFASAGGSNFNSGPSDGTVFPLLQTTVRYDQQSLGPDTAVNGEGSTATVSGGTVNVSVNALDSADVSSTWSGHDDLDWTRVGSWSTGGGAWDYDDTVGRTAVFVFGYETPASAMPTTGSATYAGQVQGSVFVPGLSAGTTHCGCDIISVTGTTSFTANFGARTVSGSMANMMTGSGQPWNSVAFSSTITSNAFSGSTWVTSSPSGQSVLASNASGSIQGMFFGPSAQEAGAIWTLFDGAKAAIGSLSGKRPGQ